MTTLDDRALIQTFLTGQAELLSNRNLRVEAVRNTHQLLARKGELIASVKLAGKIRTALVKHQSGYQELMQQVLNENGFVAIGPDNSHGFRQYAQHELPAGYRLHHSEAKLLWKAWWLNRRGHHRYDDPQPNVLIFINQTWLPVEDIGWNPEALFIKIQGVELQLKGADSVTWASQPSGDPASLPASASKITTQRPTESAPEAPGSASPYRRLRQAPEQFFGSIVRDKTSDGPADRPLPQGIEAVVQFHEGQLHISTSVGEIVVEGSNLRFWLAELQPEASFSS